MKINAENLIQSKIDMSKIPVGTTLYPGKDENGEYIYFAMPCEFSKLKEIDELQFKEWELEMEKAQIQEVIKRTQGYIDVMTESDFKEKEE
jgi:hypothetical protein